MSRIDELIAELCPDGVPHFELNGIAGYSQTRVDASEVTDDTYIGVDNLLPNKAGRTTSDYLPKTGRLTEFRPGDVLIGNIRPYLKKVWLADVRGGCNGDVLVVRIADEIVEKIDPRYLYYHLSSDAFFQFNMQHAKGAKMPRGSKKMVLKYRIPVPPLEVQREIVRILDTFTALEAELEAELEARRVQYAHYRAALLRPRSGVGEVPLGSIATIGTGSHDTKDAVPDGAYTFYARGREPLSLNSYDFDESAIITAGDGVGVGKVFHFASGKYALHQRAYRIVPNDGVDAKFLYHYLVADFARYLERTSVHASVTSLRRPMFIKYPVTLPSIEDQRRISSALDKFETYTNDISIGLPAELAARRTQYEYYRDKLLTFEEAPA